MLPQTALSGSCRQKRSERVFLYQGYAGSALYLASRRFLQHSLLYSCVQASCGLCTRLQHCLPLFGALMHILAASLVERLRTDAETQPAPRGGAKEQKKFVKKKIPALWT